MNINIIMGAVGRRLYSSFLDLSLKVENNKFQEVEKNFIGEKEQISLLQSSEMYRGYMKLNIEYQLQVWSLKTLKCLEKDNKVTQIWMTGHEWFEVNEIDEKRAKEEVTPIEPEPQRSTPHSMLKTKLNNLVGERKFSHLTRTSGLRGWK